jgi:hypothetical protein
LKRDRAGNVMVRARDLHGSTITGGGGIFQIFAPPWWRVDLWLRWVGWRLSPRQRAATGFIEITVYDGGRRRVRVFGKLP